MDSNISAIQPAGATEFPREARSGTEWALPPTIKRIFARPEKEDLRPTEVHVFLIVALLAVIVVAAVGGGVGGSIAVKKAKSSPPSSTAFDCAAVARSGSTITLGSKVWKFGVKCNLTFEGNVNLAASIAYSFEECLHSCAQTNWLLRNETDSEFGVGSVLGMRSGIVQGVEGGHREIKVGRMLRAFSGVQLELI
ncbi:hypothetical protein NEUTE2DRAFT_169564 [Neurospora tetrasperma FGSC 2509]|nr:hypothetical protein NEUTE2DRAFT_169564 [Neurospora tetrasperma FGSC 2509]